MVPIRYFDMILSFFFRLTGESVLLHLRRFGLCSRGLLDWYSPERHHSLQWTAATQRIRSIHAAPGNHSRGLRDYQHRAVGYSKWVRLFGPVQTVSLWDDARPESELDRCYGQSEE